LAIAFLIMHQLRVVLRWQVCILVATMICSVLRGVWD